MAKKRILVVVLSVLIISSALSPLAVAETSMDVVSGWWYDGSVHIWLTEDESTVLDGASVSLVQESGAFGGEIIGQETTEPVPSTESGTKEKYMLLIDLSTSMPGYIGRIEAFATSLLENTNAEITLAGFGAYFEILAEGLTEEGELVSVIENRSNYDHGATDICGGLVEAINYLASALKDDPGLTSLILITDGIEYLAGGYEDEETGIYETATRASEAISSCPEIIVHTLCFGNWNDTVYSAVSTGAGLDLVAKSVSEASASAASIAEFTDKLYEVELEMSWDTMDVRQDIKLFITSETENLYIKVENVGNILAVTEDNLVETPGLEILDPEGDAIDPETGEDSGDGGDTETDENPEESEPEEKRIEPSTEGAVTEELTDESPTEPAEEEGSTAENEISSLTVILAALVIVLLVAVIVITTILIRTRKKAKRRSSPNLAQEGRGEAVQPVKLKAIIKTGGDERELMLVLREELFIGSGNDCGITIRDSKLLAHNTRIFQENGAIYIEDLNDDSMTYLQGMRLHTRNRLRSGDEVMISNSKILFRF